MARDADPLDSALTGLAHGNQDDIYSLLAAWNTTAEAAIQQGGGNSYRELFSEYCEETIEAFDAAAAPDARPDWPFLEECASAYPSGTGDHRCTVLVANVLARCVIRTYLQDGVELIPTWALDYLGAVTMEDDGDIAWEDSGAYGWGIGHADVQVTDRILARAEADEEFWAASTLKRAVYADPEKAIDCYERILQSPDTVEDLHYLGGFELALERPWPRLPKYWEPPSKLPAPGPVSADQLDELVRVLGEHVHPGRLRQYDDQFQFDLQRAADDYGPSEAE